MEVELAEGLAPLIAAERLGRNYTPTGAVGDVKFVSLHTDKHGLVVFENEHECSEVVPASMPPGPSRSRSRRRLRWAGPDRRQGIDRERGLDRGGDLPPGGAAVASLQAVARIALALQRSFRKLEVVPEKPTAEACDSLRLPPEESAAVAFEPLPRSPWTPRAAGTCAAIRRLCATHAGEAQRAELARASAQAPRPDRELSDFRLRRRLFC